MGLGWEKVTTGGPSQTFVVQECIVDHMLACMQQCIRVPRAMEKVGDVGLAAALHHVYIEVCILACMRLHTQLVLTSGKLHPAG